MKNKLKFILLGILLAAIVDSFFAFSSAQSILIGCYSIFLIAGLLIADTEQKAEKKIKIILLLLPTFLLSVMIAFVNQYLRILLIPSIAVFSTLAIITGTMYGINKRNFILASIIIYFILFLLCYQLRLHHHNFVVSKDTPVPPPPTSIFDNY